MIQLRAILKQWFKRGCYPTEAQFSDWIDSFFHKTEDKIGIMDIEQLPEQLNGKYDKNAGEALAQDCNALRQEYGDFTEMMTSKNGEIADDLAAAEEVNTRQDADISQITSMLKGGATLEQIATALAALGPNYSTLYTVAHTLKVFLEDSDMADTTINRWEEIERFLTGITDTQTLTGLLEALRTSIVATIPTKVSQLTNDSGYLTTHQDISGKADVGHTHEIADVNGLQGVLNGKQASGSYAASSHTHSKRDITDFPTSLPASDVQSWAKAESKPTYTAAEVGALAAGGTAVNSQKVGGYSIVVGSTGSDANTIYIITD